MGARGSGRTEGTAAAGAAGGPSGRTGVAERARLDRGAYGVYSGDRFSLQAGVEPGSSGGDVDERPRVLIVEDEPESLDVARLAVEAAGAEVLVADTGEEALRIAHEERLDLILLDLALPGIDGAEVARRLRDDASTAAIPVVVVTAHVVREVVERALREGVRECIFKPYRIRQLQSVIARYLPAAPEEEGPPPGFPPLQP